MICTSLLALWGARPGWACENQEWQGDVVGVAENGRFVHYQTSTFQEKVRLLDGDGKSIAECERDLEGEEPWTCKGAVPAKPDKKSPANKVAADWLAKIAGVPLGLDKEMPPGVRDLFCAHMSATNPNSGEPFACDSGKTDLLISTRSKLIFFRYQFDFRFCGSKESYKDVEWSARGTLEARLKKRAARLSTQRKWRLAERALEALVWFTHDPATTKELEAVKAKAAAGSP